METIALHLTFDLQGRLPIARSPEEWERATRTLLRTAEKWNDLGSCVVHDHAHELLAADRETAGRAAQAIECALGWFRRSPGTPRRQTWNPPRLTVIRDRRHLRDTAAYVLCNGAVATGSDPLGWRWSSGWDLLGLRVPRTRLAAGFEVTTPAFAAEVLVGDPKWRPREAARLASPAESPAQLAQIAAACLGFAAGPAAMRRGDRTRWRALGVALGIHRGWSPADMAGPLGIHARHARGLLERGPCPDLPCALRLLGVIEAGAPAAELLRPLPPDPLPFGARKKAVPGSWLLKRR
jgi:hypothetical protein